MDTPEENKALILRAYEEIWSRGNLSVIDDIVASDCEAYSPQNPEEPVDIEAAHKSVAAVRHAFPDLVRTAEEMIAEADKVVVRSRMRGTHLGEFNGVPSTGARVELYAITIYRIEKGKIAYEWTISDSAGLMQRLEAALK